jgi:type III secretion system FlhB-like substrate exporter
MERARGIHERVMTLDTHVDISPGRVIPSAYLRGDMIPPELYEIVAEILVYVDKMDRIKGKVDN